MVSRADATQFIVEILEGPLGGQSIALQGRALPYRAGAGGNIAFGTTQRSKLVWYQGSRDASQLIFGPTIKPTTINGQWKDRYLGTDESIRLVELFEQLCNEGSQVRMFWSTIVRQGIVKEINWKPGAPTGGLGDIEWDITFEWNSRGGQPQPVVSGTTVFGAATIAQKNAVTYLDLQNQSQAFVSAINTYVGAVNLAVLSNIQTLSSVLSSGQAATTTMTAMATDLESTQSLPARTAQQLQTALSKLISTWASNAITLETVTVDAAIASDGIADILNFENLRRDLLENIYFGMIASFDDRLRLAALINPDAFAIVRIPTGTDLREVARAFYGNSDLWKRIATVNGLTQSLVPDTVVEILVPSTLTATQDASATGVQSSSGGTGS